MYCLNLSHKLEHSRYKVLQHAHSWPYCSHHKLVGSDASLYNQQQTTVGSCRTTLLSSSSRVTAHSLRPEVPRDPHALARTRSVSARRTKKERKRASHYDETRRQTDAPAWRATIGLLRSNRNRGGVRRPRPARLLSADDVPQSERAMPSLGGVGCARNGSCVRSLCT